MNLNRNRTKTKQCAPTPYGVGEWALVTMNEQCKSAGFVQRLCVVEKDETESGIMLAGFYKPSRACEQTASLMAAAPELFEACSRALDHQLEAGMGGNPCDDVLLSQLRAAIAKAKEGAS